MTDEAIADEWRAIEALRQPLIGNAEERVESYFDRLRDEVVSQIEAQKSVKDFVLADVFDPEFWTTEMRDLLAEVATAALQQGGQAALSRIGSSADFDGDNPRTQEAIRRLIEKVEQSITPTTADAIQEEINDGLSENQSVSEIASRVASRLDDEKAQRADAIAQTAVTGGFENGQLQAFRDAGFDQKRWISQRDGRVRESHQEADGQRVDLEAPFTVGGASLMHPGDPNGPADEVVRCRCTMFPVNEEDDPEGFTP